MPEYLFKNLKTGQLKTFFYHMDEIKNPGPNWERVFVTSAIGVDGKILNCFSEKEFIEKTGKKRMNVGEYWEESAIQSEKRARIAGVDPVKTSYYDKWAKRRHNKKQHPDLVKKKVIEDASKKGIVLED